MPRARQVAGVNYSPRARGRVAPVVADGGGDGAKALQLDAQTLQLNGQDLILGSA